MAKSSPKLDASPIHGKQVGGTFNPMQIVVLAALSAAVAAMAALAATAHRFGIQPGELTEPMITVEPFLPYLLMAVGTGMALAVVLSRFRQSWRKSITWRMLPFGLLILAGGAAGFPNGDMYAPADLIHWTRWLAEQGLLEIRNEALTLFGMMWAPIAITLIAAAKPGPRKNSGSYGTARWNDGSLLREDKGLILGRDLDQGGLFRWVTDGHLLTVARTRSGKGVGSIIPNLLKYDGPVFVTDPKGENFQVTGKHRTEVLRQHAVALDPFREVTPPPPKGTPRGACAGTLNVLAGVPNRVGAVVEAADLTAEMLVIKSGRGGEGSFWDTEAQAWISALVLYALAEKHNGYQIPPGHTADSDPLGRPTIRNVGSLVRVRQLLRLGNDGTTALINVMKMRSDFGGRVAEAGHSFEMKAEKERSGVISTAQSHTHFLNSPEIQDVLANGDNPVDLNLLATGALSLFVVLPASRLDAYARWQRLIVAYALKAITDAETRPKKRVLFMLDEFANLQRIDPVRRAVSLLAGYGASLWIFVQDLSQLKSLYGEGYETFIANSEVLQVFGTADIMTAEYISKRAGDTTVWTETQSTSRGRSKGSTSRNRSNNVSEKGRALISPDEVLTEDERSQLLFIAGHLPIRAAKVRYFEDDEFKGAFGQAKMQKVAA